MKLAAITVAAAALAVAACGQQGGDTGDNAAAADGNLTIEPLGNAVEPPAAEETNAAGDAAPSPGAPAAAPEPRAEPAPKAVPRSEPRRTPAPKAQPKETEPDPHAGHDMTNMSDD